MSETSCQTPATELSRLVPLDAIGDEEIERQIEASTEERQALAERLDLISLDRLVAELRLRRPLGGNLIRVSGRFEAEVTQACVVSLVPVHSMLARDIALVYCLSPAGDAVEGTVEVDVELNDPPEAVGPEGLDLGEAVVQQLAVHLNPYPRAAEARLEQTDWAPVGEGKVAESSPFQILKTLKDEE
jgi:uncharacterized metal-binding protein YceD (DUF177 family)